MSVGHHERSTLVNGSAPAVPLADRVPPQHLEAEKGVIGSILLAPEAADEVMPVLRPEDMYRAGHVIILTHLYAMRGEGVPIDTITLEDRLLTSGQLDKVGGIGAIVEIVNGVPHSLNARYYAQIVREKAVARQLIEIGNDLLRRGYAGDSTADELLASAESAVSSIREDFGAGSTAPVTLSDAVSEALALIRRRHVGEVVGVQSGLADLDELVGDMTPPQLIVAAARPGHGKSSFGLQAALHCAGPLFARPVLFVSLEMGRTELATRILAMRSGVDGHLLNKSYLMTPDQMLAVEEVAGPSEEADRLEIDHAPGQTVAAIAATARRFKARRGSVGLLVVDYLQMVRPDDPKAPRQEQVAAVSRSLKEIAKELECPLLALAQINRESEKREDRRPRLADLRESGGIEADADRVILLHRPSYYNPDDRPGMADLIVAKNRGGRTGTVEVAWNGPLTRFENPPADLPDF